MAGAGKIGIGSLFTRARPATKLAGMILPTRRFPLAVLGAVLAAGSVTHAAEARIKPPTVPAEIRVEAGHKVFAYGHAVGVQIYACNATAAGGHAWSFVAPRADLYNQRGKHKMIHFAGPTWQHKDGSQVVAQLVRPAPVTNPTAIPWLLLSTKSTTPGPFGRKLLKTTFIQRVNTTGGLAPAAALCNAQTAGTQAEVPYTADYYFWKAK